MGVTGVTVKSKKIDLPQFLQLKTALYELMDPYRSVHKTPERVPSLNLSLNVRKLATISRHLKPLLRFSLDTQKPARGGLLD